MTENDFEHLEVGSVISYRHTCQGIIIAIIPRVELKNGVVVLWNDDGQTTYESGNMIGHYDYQLVYL